jgi:hypothetical protein
MHSLGLLTLHFSCLFAALFSTAHWTECSTNPSSRDARTPPRISTPSQACNRAPLQRPKSFKPLFLKEVDPPFVHDRFFQLQPVERSVVRQLFCILQHTM